MGRFLSVDPLSPDYPWYTPYQFAGNKPIRFIDLDGLEEADPMSDPYWGTKMVLTSFYDIKHSAENLILRVLPRPERVPEGMKLLAGYKIDGNGNQIYETEFKIVPLDNPTKEFAATLLDIVNVAAIGKFDPSDIISVKTGKTVVTESTKALRTGSGTTNGIPNNPGTVRRFVSKSEAKKLKKEGFEYDPKDSRGGLSSTSTKIEPINPDNIKQSTGAFAADRYLDIDVTNKNVQLKGKTKGGVPDWKIKDNISPNDIIDSGTVRKQ